MKIAISGGGLAGLSAAIYLHRAGHQVRVYEKATAFKRQGYGLSVKSFGIKILKELGVYENLKELGLPVTAFNFYGKGGQLIRSIPEEVAAAMTGGAFPIGRADLHQVLYQELDKNIPVCFNKTITAIVQSADKATLTFSDGEKEDCDLLVIAEGLRSTTRRLLCGDLGWTPFEISYAATQLSRFHPFPPGAAYAYKGVGTSIIFFPVDHKRLVIQATFRDRTQRGLSQEAVKRLLMEKFKDFPGEVTSALGCILPEDQVFYDGVGMVSLPRLAWDRAVIIGDAGYSTTFLSGMGTSLSLLGARLLSQHLSATPDLHTALGQFQDAMLPVAQRFQGFAGENMERELPRKFWKLALGNLIMRWLPFSVMTKSVADRFEVEREIPE